jgi:hypothetical protein
MAVAALPDLQVLSVDSLRTLILSQHEQLVSTEDKLLSAESKLTTTQEQLQSREREIEHLKLLLVKLHRMQFGRKSEKLARQIEQLELRLEELESNRSEKESMPPEPASVPTGSAASAAKPARHALPDHLPRQTRRHAPKETVCPQCQGELRKLGEDVFGDAGVRARQFRGDSSCSHQAELHEVRLHRAGGSTESPDRARASRAGAAGACAGVEVLRPSATVS